MRSYVKTIPHAQFGEVEGGKDICPDQAGQYQLFDDETIQVQAASMSHSVPCVGFVVTEKPRRGRLRVEAIEPLITKNKVKYLFSNTER
jgi:ribonuclease BN (tRNA processing enzyme)